jgi:WD40 repeat protein/ABC-type transport system substrate-binding protein
MEKAPKDALDLDTTIYTVGGTVQAGSGLYIPRHSDNDLLILCQEGAFAYVLAPRQLGKSSLMIRTAERLQEEGVLSVIIDLTQLGVQLSADAWYLGLLTVLEDSLMLDTDVVSWWQAHSHLGNAQRLILFLQNLVTTRLDQPLVIFVDEIDTTLSLDFTDDFYAAIRSLYVARARVPELKRLSFVLIGVASPGDLIRDPKRTPFNIGQRVEMTDFKLEEALPLAKGLGAKPGEEKEALGWVFKWTGGHPYLTQRLCRVIAEQETGARKWGEGLTEDRVDQAVNETFFGQKSFQDNNLQFVRDMLTRRTVDLEEVLSTYRQIRAGKQQVGDDEQSLVKSHLKLSGIVKVQGAALRVRNEVYHTVFDEKWIKEHLPVNWAKRLRQALGIIAASLALALVMGGLAVYALVQQGAANDRAAEAIAARNTAEARRVETEQQAQISRAQALAANAVAQLEDDPERGILLAVEAVKLAQQPGISTALPQASDALRQSLERAQLGRFTLDAHANQVFDGNFSPDGRYIVTAHNDGSARVWDAATGKALFSLKAPTGSLRRAFFSPDGRYILTTNTDGTAEIWDAQTGKALASLQSYTGDITNTDSGATNGRGVAFSPDSRLVVTAGGDGVARIWDVATGQLFHELKGHTGPVDDASFSPDGQYVVTASDDATAKLWEVSSGREIVTLQGHTGGVVRARFSPDGHYVATVGDNNPIVYEVPTGRVVATLKGHQFGVVGVVFSPDSHFVLTFSWDTTAKLWQLPDGKELVTYKGHSSSINNAAFSPDGRYIVTAGSDHLAKVWETQSGREVFTYKGHSGPVDSVAFSPDGRYIISTSVDGTARVWESLPGKGLATFYGDSKPLNSAAFSPDGRYLVVVAGNDNTAKVWDTRLRKLAGTLPGHTDWVTSAVFSPDGKYLLTGSRDNTARVWEFDSSSGTSKELIEIKGHTGPVNSVAFSPDGRFVVTASDDQTARLWESETGKPLAVFSGHTAALTGAAFSPDGRLIVTASLDGTARVWDVSTAKELTVLKGQSGPVNSAAFSPDGRYVLTGGRDATARLWEAASGKEINHYKGHTAALNQVAFSPTGFYLVTASADGTAKVWEVQSGKEVTTLKGHTGAVNSVAISPDGNYLVTTGADQTAQVEIFTPEEMLRVAQSRLTRSLSADERVQFGFDPPPTPAPSPAVTTTAAIPTPLQATLTPTPINPAVLAALTASPAANPTTLTFAALTPASPGFSSQASLGLIEDVKFDPNGKRGGILNLPGYEGGNFNPYYWVNSDSFSIPIVNATLVGVSDHAKYYPYLLAEVPTLDNGGVKLSADGKAMDLVLKLKPGLMWSDGSPLTSKDVAFTVKWVNDPDQDTNLSADPSIWGTIKQVDTPDNQTAILHFSQLYSPYLDFLSIFYPLPEKVWGKIPVKNGQAAHSPEAALPTATSGPFKVQANMHSDHLELVRNDYFSPVFGFNAYLDKIVFRPYPTALSIPDTATVLAGIAKGELDALPISRDQIEPFSKIPNSYYVNDGQTASEYLQLNLTNPLFQDKAVRKALDLALDKPALIKLSVYPLAQQTPLVMPPIMLFADHSLPPVSYNPDAARELLETAGWKSGPDGIRTKDGRRLAFTLVSTDRSNRRLVAQAIVDYWKAIGAEVSYRVVNHTDLFSVWDQNGRLAHGQFDVAMFASSVSLDNDAWYYNYHSSEIPTDTNKGQGANYGRISNPLLDQALDLQRSTPDLAKRKAAWDTIQQILYENVYEISLFTSGDYYWVSNRVKNFRPFQENYWNAVEMYLD